MMPTVATSRADWPNGVVIGCLYLPNSNPAPGPKFDYEELRWLDRLIAHAAELDLPWLPGGHLPWRLASAFLQGGMSTSRSAGSTTRPLPGRRLREAFATTARPRMDRCHTGLHPDEKIYTFWDYFRNAYGRDAGLRIEHLLP